jgi:hypothetical protein
MGSETEAKLIEFCLRSQLERNPVTTDDATEFIREAGSKQTESGLMDLLSATKTSSQCMKQYSWRKSGTKRRRTTWSIISKQLVCI